nr:translesion error-prone DNA polymerase V autoproteolytic subunit [uncultured Halomonas sp.]
MTIAIDIIGRVDEYNQPTLVPLAAGEVRAGFPSPADDYLGRELDLVGHLIQHPSATYYVRAKGDSMVHFGIYDGDLLIVDRSLDPRPGDILIAVVDGELTCKRLGMANGCSALISGNSAYTPIILDGCDVMI